MDNNTSLETYLKENGTLLYAIRGVSMLPLLRQDRDLVMLERPRERCRPGDVVLYRRASGQYVLHRVIAVRPADYVILGDNCANREYGVTDDDILGVMTGFVRNGREHSVTERGYRLYTAYILRAVGPRRACRRAWSRLRALGSRAKRALRRILPG